MAGDHRALGVPEPVLDGAGLRIAVVSARWNSEITMRLLDGVRRGLAAAGVAAIVQPGGSQADDEVIATANRLGLVLVFTGRRHFKH